MSLTILVTVHHCEDRTLKQMVPTHPLSRAKRDKCVITAQLLCLSFYLRAPPRKQCVHIQCESFHPVAQWKQPTDVPTLQAGPGNTSLRLSPDDFRPCQVGKPKHQKWSMGCFLWGSSYMSQDTLPGLSLWWEKLHSLWKTFWSVSESRYTFQALPSVEEVASFGPYLVCNTNGIPISPKRSNIWSQGPPGKGNRGMGGIDEKDY